MKRSVKYVVLPYKVLKGRPRLGEMRQASSQESAIRLAERLAAHYDGVAAYEVLVDTETGDMNEPRELAVFGHVEHFHREAA